MTARTRRQFGEKSALYNLIEILRPRAWPDVGCEAAHRSNYEDLLRVLPEELEDVLLAGRHRRTMADAGHLDILVLYPHVLHRRGQSPCVFDKNQLVLVALHDQYGKPGVQ
jgi:hypothetical protein